MAIIRVQHTKDYTVMSNHHLRNKELSLRAKGLMSQMLSLPSGWDFTVSGLVHINKEKSTAIESALAELKQAGYLVVTKLMPNQTETGRYQYVYDLYEIPQEQGAEKQGVEKQGVENLGLEIQGVENLAVNKDTESLITDNKETEKNRHKFRKPTLDEIRVYCVKRNNNIDPEKFYDYYEANGWKVGGRSPMKDWTAAVRNWERMEKIGIESSNGQKLMYSHNGQNLMYSQKEYDIIVDRNISVSKKRQLKGGAE